MSRLQRSVRYLGGALFALVSLIPILGSVVTTDFFIVREAEPPLREDVYVASTSGFVEGVIEGDLFIFTGDLTISGTVTGTVTAVSSGTVTVAEGGVIEGSLRATARRVDVDGEVGDDVASAAISTTVGADGNVGRDVITFGADLDIAGAVGRDVRGRVVNVTVSGAIGNDLDMTVSRLGITDTATIGGDVLYRSSGEAAIAAGSSIAGQVVRLPVQANFIYGVILTLANVVSLLAFLVTGFAALWILRNTSAAAVSAVSRKPLRSILVGLLAVIVTPVLVVLFAVTLVGLPLSGALVVLMMLALVIGPLPAVTAFGDLILRHKGGLFGAFLLGALIWRLGIWFIPDIIPLLGVLLFVIGLVWGVGAWIVGGWDLRHGEGVAASLIPPAMIVEDDELPPGWEFPLPPEPKEEPAEAKGVAEGPAETEGVEGEPDSRDATQSRTEPDEWGLPGN